MMIVLLIMIAVVTKVENTRKSTIFLSPQFSRGGGFYDEEFYLRLFTYDKNDVIYYTLDGSSPDPIQNPHNTYIYGERIPIRSRKGDANILSNIPTTVYNPRNTWKPPMEEVFKATVVRAAAYRNGEAIGDIVTHTYWVDEDIGDRYTFPVISIVTDRENFFDEEKGIYVPGSLYDEGANPPYITGNYFQQGAEWERIASMEFYEPHGELGFSQRVGVRIHGGSSRLEPQKTLRLYTRREYGENAISYKLFPDSDIEEYKRLLLRNSGNEWGNTMFLDALAQGIIKDMNFETQAYRPAVVFINGEYWGIHNIRERYDDWYFEIKYGIAREDVVILEFQWSVDTGVEGDEAHFVDMLTFMEENDMNLPENYQQAHTMMDVDNFIDYQVAQIFFANIDWPQTNVYYWRKRTEAYDPTAPYGHDGRWRWMVFDLDASFGFWGTNYDTRSLEMASDPDYNHNGIWGGRDWSWSTLLFRLLLENQDFQHQFINTFADHLNTTFQKERVLKAIDEMQFIYEPEIGEHIKRWGYPSSIEEWYENVEGLRNFARKRPEYVRLHIMEKFNLEEMATVTIDAPEGWEGTVKVNNISIDASQLPWRGTYFHGVPITITAIPQEGTTFRGWGGDRSGDDSTLTVDPKGSMEFRIK